MKAQNRIHQIKAFILAGGIGRRLSPLTDLRPKPAVSFAGIFRIIDFTLANCRASRIADVSLLTQYRGEQLQEYVRKTWNLSWDQHQRQQSHITCLAPADGKSYKGTADAVLQNLTMLNANKTEHILVLSGDHVYYMDYRKFLDFHIDANADLTIAATERSIEKARNFGVLDTDGKHRVIGFAEKPTLPKPMPGRPDHSRISMGIYAFRREVLIDALHDVCHKGHGSDFGHDVIPALVKSGRVSSYDFGGYWRDIGSIDSYYRSSMELLDPDAQFNPYDENFRWCPASSRFSRLLDVDKLDELLRNHAFSNPAVSRSVTSRGVQIAEDAVIEDSVLLPGARIGKRARLRRVIVDEGVEIPDGCDIGWDLDRDRERYSVTPTDVVVVSYTPRPSERATVIEFMPAQSKYSQRLQGSLRDP
jgi:glucose-1-phosphate adenylyltransferase